uniref:Putative leucine-rich repeat protein n=1 Tax=Culex tarsalis TaxID=7177 RepID=A0A1Q3FQX8_CULTA
MRQILWTISILLLSTSSQATRIVREHRCVSPASEDMCILQEVFYNRSTTDNVFPQNHTHVQIGSDFTRTFQSLVRILDGQLFRELGEPKALELTYVKLDTLEIPRKLVLGNFAFNLLKEFWLEPGEMAPALSYLDLSRNDLTNLTNISSLVNLESLYLVNNEIKHVEPNTFAGLTKLKMLNLNHNDIEVIHGADLPASLIWLRIAGNKIKSLNAGEMNLPLLQYLDISDNHLTSLNGAELIMAKPNLLEVLLGGNRFDLATVQKVTDLFKRHNVSYTLVEENETREHMYCDHRSKLVNGVCVQRDQIPNSWLKNTGLSVLTVLVAALFGLVVRWVFLAMSK